MASKGLRGKRHQRVEVTKALALREAVSLFLEQGYHETTLQQIADRIDRSQAALLRAFQDKEAILYALVTHMFGSQFDKARMMLGQDADPLLVYGVETALQLHICELSEPLRDLYVTAYTLPSTLDYIYHSTTRELQQTFAEYMPGAAESNFYELEVASGSIMRGYMAKPCDMYFSIERKVTLLLNCCFKIYDVPKDKREAVIAKVLSMDMAAMAQRTIMETVKLAQAGFGMEILDDGNEM